MKAPAPTVLLAPRITDDSKVIWKTCVDLGWPVQRLPGWRVPEGMTFPGEVLIYAEPLFAEAVADQLGLALLEPSVDWLPSLPEEWLSRRISLSTLAQARGLQAPAFVKPAEGKTFEARVYPDGSALPGEETVDGSLPVLCSEIVDFRLEVRCIVKDRTLLTLSPYWRDGDLALAADGTWPFLPGEEAAARAFLARFLADARVELPPACTVDTGILANGAWAVIEANPVWGAGLYGGDPRDVLAAIRGAILPLSGLRPGDRRWVSGRQEGK